MGQHSFLLLIKIFFSNFEEKLENIFLQCEKNILKQSENHWNSSKSEILKKQIYDLKSKENLIRNLASSFFKLFLLIILYFELKL